MLNKIKRYDVINDQCFVILIIEFNLKRKVPTFKETLALFIVTRG